MTDVILGLELQIAEATVIVEPKAISDLKKAGFSYIKPNDKTIDLGHLDGVQALKDIGVNADDLPGVLKDVLDTVKKADVSIEELEIKIPGSESAEKEMKYRLVFKAKWETDAPSLFGIKLKSATFGAATSPATASKTTSNGDSPSTAQALQIGDGHDSRPSLPPAPSSKKARKR